MRYQHVIPPIRIDMGILQCIVGKYDSHESGL